MTKRVLALLLGACLAIGAGARAQDGGGGGGGAAPAPPAPAPVAAKKAVKEPSKAVAARIEEGLRAAFGSSAAARLTARASLDAAVAEWAADAKEDPLRSVAWWQGALASGLPAGNRRPGIAAEKYAYADGREATIWVSTPKSYGPKTFSPAILVFLERGEDPRKALPALYGDLLKDWLAVALVADPKESGLDLLKEPWLAAVGLRYAVEHLRVDRHRLVLDGTGTANANLALSIGAEWAVHFAGVVLRGPTVPSPLVANLALGGALLLAPEAATEPQKKIASDLRGAVPQVAFGPDGKAGHETAQKWIAALPPRRIAQPGNASFSWRTRPQGGEAWAYWLWVFRAGDPKKERMVEVNLAKDAGTNAVDITGENLGEGLLLLNDDFLDLDRDVIVRVNGKEVFKGRAARQVRTALYWIAQTGERTLFAPAEIRFTVPADAQSAKKPGDGAPAGGPADGAPAPPPPPPPPPGPGPKEPPKPADGGGGGGGG